MGLSVGTSAYRTRVLSDGASYYWRLGDPSGTTAAAEVGGVPGTISGGVTLGQPGAMADGSTAMTFNGTTGKILTAGNITIVPPVTIEFWARTSTANTVFLGSRHQPPNPDFDVVVCDTVGIYPQFSVNHAGGIGSNSYSTAKTVTDGQWHHVVWLVTGTGAQLYLDGLSRAMAGSFAQPFVGTTLRPLEIGAQTDWYGLFYNGTLQDVAIYPRALTAPEIAAHYALRTAAIPPPVAQAYTWARSGIARSDATRSNYVLAFSTVDLIVRDGAGNIVSRTDLTNYIRRDSLQVTQALNDEADTCSFQIIPTAPAAAVPQVGQEIAVAWTPGDVLFRGYALVVQFDRRPMNESPWVSVQCQDAMWRFDARMVSYRFPAQSVTSSIAFLVRWFCNLSGVTTSPSDFKTSFVQPGMPSIAAFDVVNQRPSTVMRTLMAAVQGGFYVDGFDVHAWAGSLSEPAQSNPQPLTNTLATLKAFRVTHDATQLRKRVLVEGRRTTTTISLPALPATHNEELLGVALDDATLFDLTAPPSFYQLIRMGTQWMRLGVPISVTGDGANPPQTKTHVAYTVGSVALVLKAMPMTPPSRGWIRVGNQTVPYTGYSGTPTTDGWTLNLPDPVLYPHYGRFTVAIAAGETVEWIDGALSLLLYDMPWAASGTADLFSRAHPVDTPVVTIAEAARPLGAWPPLEGFVQDGRYSYAGAQARAEADLDAFAEPLVSADWETDDNNASPGRQQVINLTGSSVIDPLSTTLTITRVDLSFPLRTERPRRRCTGGVVKPSTFMDLVVTEQG